MLLNKNKTRFFFFQDSQMGVGGTANREAVARLEELKNSVASNESTERFFPIEKYDQLVNRIASLDERSPDWQNISRKVLDLIALHDGNKMTNSWDDFKVNGKDQVMNLLRQLRYMIYKKPSASETYPEIPQASLDRVKFIESLEKQFSAEQKQNKQWIDKQLYTSGAKSWRNGDVYDLKEVAGFDRLQTLLNTINLNKNRISNISVEAQPSMLDFRDNRNQSKFYIIRLYLDNSSQPRSYTMKPDFSDMRDDLVGNPNDLVKGLKAMNIPHQLNVVDYSPSMVEYNNLKDTGANKQKVAENTTVKDVKYKIMTNTEWEEVVRKSLDRINNLSIKSSLDNLDLALNKKPLQKALVLQVLDILDDQIYGLKFNDRDLPVVTRLFNNIVTKYTVANGLPPLLKGQSTQAQNIMYSTRQLKDQILGNRR